MDLETKRDIDGLGSRLNNLVTEITTYKAVTDNELLHLKEAHRGNCQDIRDIKNTLKDITKQLTGLTIKVSLIVSIIVLVINLFVPYILTLVHISSK
jgi:hypothetical protein